MSSQPLTGKRIVVTRARSQASSFVAALANLGAEVIELPTIETVPLESYETLDNALRNIADYQWLIVTSANAVRVLAERLAALNLPPATLAPPRKAAIGSATAKAMREQGFAADLVPEQYVAESLANALGDQVAGRRILLARASIARDVVPAELTRRGALVDVVDAYRTAIPEGAVDRVRDVFSDPSRMPDAVTFTSSSTVKNFFALRRESGFGGPPQGIAALSIGPVTSQTLREFGWEPARQAKKHNVEGLVDAVVGHEEIRALEERERQGFLLRPNDPTEVGMREAEVVEPEE